VNYKADSRIQARNMILVDIL